MLSQEVFLAYVCENPDDDAPRLVYADWLDEHGEPARAEFIRAQCELARLPEGDPRRATLSARAEELLREHGAAWTPGLGRDVCSWLFHRGFVEEVAMSAGAFLKRGERLCHLIPLRRVMLTHAGRHVAGLAASPLFARLRSVKLLGFQGDEAGLAAVLSSPHLFKVEELDLGCNQVGAEVVRALVRAPWVSWLRSLALRHNRLDDDEARVLAGCPGLGRLGALDLAGNQVGDAGLKALARSPYLAVLSSLDLADNRVGDAGLRALASSPRVGTLRVLGLARNRIGDGGARALAASGHLPALRVLDLSRNRIGDPGARALARSPFPARLEWLNLAGNRIGEGGARELRACLPGRGAALGMSL